MSDAPLCRFETIVLATDGSEFSESAEAVGLDLAQRCGARLILARIIPTDTQHDALSPRRSHDASVTAQGDLDVLEKRRASRASMPCPSCATEWTGIRRSSRSPRSTRPA